MKKLVVLMAALALLLIACSNTGPTETDKWTLVSEGSDGGFEASVIQMHWDEGRNSEFRILVKRLDSDEVGRVEPTRGEYAALYRQWQQDTEGTLTIWVKP